MRLAQVGVGSGDGLPGLHKSLRSWSGPRPNFPFQKRQTTTATCDPPERSSKPFYKKTPLLQPPREESQAKTVANTGSRKHAVSSAHSSSAYLLRQRAGLSYFANSEPYLAIAYPRVNVLNPFGIKYFVGNPTLVAG